MVVSKYHISKKRKQHFLKPSDLEEERYEEGVHGHESSLAKRDQKTLNLLATGCFKYPPVEDEESEGCLFTPVELNKPSNIVKQTNFACLQRN